MDFVRFVSAAGGLLIILTTVYWSARILMVKGTDPPIFARFIFRTCRNALHFAGNLMRSDERRRELWALYIPASLISILACSLVFATIGYMFLIYGVTENSMRTAYQNSVSSMSVLGIAGEPPTLIETTIAGIEAFTGPIFVALLIAYTVTIYSDYNKHRESIYAFDSQLSEFGAGQELIVYAARAQGIDALTPLWKTLVEDFGRLEMTYRSVDGYLLLFAPNMTSHWSIDVPDLLDAAAQRNSLIAGTPNDVASQALSFGSVALRDVTSHYQHRVLSLRKPTPNKAIDRTGFDRIARELVAIGIPVVADLDRAWIDFEDLRAGYQPKVELLTKLLPSSRRSQ